MHSSPLPLTRDLVLIGGGHTHALVLRMWGMNPLAGVRVTVIDPVPATAYSGMLPGFVAGHYSRRELDIDLVKLARFAGARLITGPAVAIDPVDQTVTVPGREPVAYDVASIDIGITSAMPALKGFPKHGVPAKPLGPFADAWTTHLATNPSEPVAIIGGGIAGCELSMAMAHALRATGSDAPVHLLERGILLSDNSESAQRKIRKSMADLGITIHENVQISEINATALVLADGATIQASFITGAAGAKAYDWLGTSGLNLHNGFVAVNSRLQSSVDNIFATGDCAHMIDTPRPKAGVFAVRQAPVLFQNLRAALGTDKWADYKPQNDYLKLVSLGQKSALAEKFGLTFTGPLLWRWKNRIDQKFMEKFRDLPRMEQPKLPSEIAHGMKDALGDKPMCGGCGAKVGSTTLSGVLSRLPATQRTDIRSTIGDDAATMLVGGVEQVLTTDHLRAFTTDPVVMTRIAANHALGDIWAMGAEPQGATVNLVLPRLSDTLMGRTLHEIMQTAHEVMSDAGAAIVGGHSSVGDELTIGFSITGLCHQPPITVAGAKAGAAIILTKPIGSGTIMAAEMQGKADGHIVTKALDLMRQSQARAADILKNAQAMTDVTGFGLAGHIFNICKSSGTGAVLPMADIPLMEGAAELAQKGLRSSLYPQNKAAFPELPDTPETALLFDPQTAGGLLAIMDTQSAESAINDLKIAGYQAAIIGKTTENPGQIELA